MQLSGTMFQSTPPQGERLNDTCEDCLKLEVSIHAPAGGATKLTVAEVKEYAMANYEKGGDQIIECWEDSTIQEWVEEDGTLKGLKKIIRYRESIRQDIVNA